MRSRYSAYVMGLEDYLRTSWHPDRCPQTIGMQGQLRPKWLGLTVKAHHWNDENHATVEFVARYKLNGRAYRLHEISRFERISGRWVYVDGDEKD